jgi:hypothetical protein
MKTISYMIFIFVVITFISGCGNVSDSENTEQAKVVNVSVMDGGVISQNYPIIVEFNKPMKSAEISIYEHSCGQIAYGETELDGKIATWKWGTYTPSGFDWGFELFYAGNCTLTVKGIDESGQEIEKFKVINFQINAPS